MSTSTDKLHDALIEMGTAFFKQVEKALDLAVEAAERYEKMSRPDSEVKINETPNFREPYAEPNADHAFDTDKSRTVASLRMHISDLEAQQRSDVSRMAELVSQQEQVSRQLAHASLRIERMEYTRPQMRFEEGGGRTVWFLHAVAQNIDGTDVIVKSEQGEERRMPLGQWWTWEIV